MNIPQLIATTLSCVNSFIRNFPLVSGASRLYTHCLTLRGRRIAKRSAREAVARTARL
jgi:hypothetical protein